MGPRRMGGARWAWTRLPSRAATRARSSSAWGVTRSSVSTSASAFEGTVVRVRTHMALPPHTSRLFCRMPRPGQCARGTRPMSEAADCLIAGCLALTHLEERPDVGRRVRAVEDHRVEAAEAQPERRKLGLRFRGEEESLWPVVVANRWQFAKQHLVAEQSGGCGGRRRGCVVGIGLPTCGVVDGFEPEA